MIAVLEAHKIVAGARDLHIRTMMAEGVNLHERLCAAVSGHRLLIYFLPVGSEAAALYGSGVRTVEPHAYGTTHDGDAALFSWRWEAKGSESTAAAGWELVRLDEMHDVQILDETFPGPAQGYRRGNKEMREIHVEV